MQQYKRIAITGIVALALACGFAGTGWAQEGGGQDEMMATMMKLATPGEHHEHLGHLVGNWNVEVKMWMAPDAPPMETSGTMTADWIMDGRFVESHYDGEAMGMPFKGRGLEGYDNYKNAYVGSWVDTMGTMMMTYEGSCEDGGKKRVAIAEFADPMSGQPVKHKMVTTAIDDDHYTYEAYMVDPSGSSFQVMELTATRQ